MSSGAVPVRAPWRRLAPQMTNTMFKFDKAFFARSADQDDRIWIDGMLREIRTHLPKMLQAHPHRADFWKWFCGETDSALSATSSPNERAYFEDQINTILKTAGLDERFVPSPSPRNPHCVR